MKKIIVIVGPTGIGKTALSIYLAKKLDGEIINADSTQIYKELNIGTAKIKEEEKEGIVHHLLDIKAPNEDYSVYDYQKDAKKIIDDVIKRNKIVIITGGSLLYLNAILYDYRFKEERSNKNIDINLSFTEMYEEIIKKWPTIKLDKNNHQRIQRAYTKYIINEEKVEENGNRLVYDCHIIGLTTNRETLYERINNRTIKMLDDGLLEEVRNLYEKYPNSKILSTAIGYKEFIDFLQKKVTLDEVIDKIKQHSRNYAKRQYTWYKNKMKEIVWFDVNLDNFNDTLIEILNYLESRN